MGLRLQRRARRGRVGRNWDDRRRRTGSSLLDRVHLGAGCHDAQAGARRASRGGLGTPRESQRVWTRGAAARGEGGHGEGTGRGRARHAAAPGNWRGETRNRSGRRTGESTAAARVREGESSSRWCSAFRRVGETGRQRERAPRREAALADDGSGFRGPELAWAKTQEQHRP